MKEGVLLTIQELHVESEATKYLISIVMLSRFWNLNKRPFIRLTRIGWLTLKLYQASKEHERDANIGEKKSTNENKMDMRKLNEEVSDEK